jgi:hypothetical protein
VVLRLPPYRPLHCGGQGLGGNLDGHWCKTGGAVACRIFSLLFVDRGWGVEWILKLAAAGDEGPCVDIMEISKPDDLGDIANLRLTHMEAKQLLARVQREISTAQARQHAVRRPVCPCRVHDAPVAPLGQSRRNPTGLEQRRCDDEAEAVVAAAASSKFAP